jgi:Zn-finger nucleic acid-binding protein
VSAAYRETPLLCPGCGETLDPREVGDAIIDVCPACGGIWVDWFDGDLVVMVRGAPPAPGAQIPGAPGSSSCPRCRRALGGERYLESHAEIMRCGDCAGAFVPRGSVSALVMLDPHVHEEAPAPHDPLARLALVLRRWLGWKGSEERS